MIIAVASGKGGTGKTTIAVSIALSIKDAQIIDCDVEEPNVHLFLKPKIKEIKKVKSLIPKVNKNKCNFCGYCSEICAYNAISVFKVENYADVIIFPTLCHGCKGCILLCPEEAMEEEYRVIGKITIGDKNGLEFVEGRLNVSEILAPKVIEEAKKYIKSDKIVIIDAPPGTSCPAVASIKDSDYCILVTEPTPFGLHDLELAYEVTKALNIPAGVIINKSGKDEIIEKFCKEREIPILLKIPFSKEIAESYSRGIPLIEKKPEYKKAFLKLIHNLTKY